MMVSRWSFKAKFGHKQQAITLIKEWFAEIGSQTDIDVSGVRIVTGSVGADEALVEVEFETPGLDALQQFFDRIATIQLHAEWGPKMGEVIVSGSTRWEVFRVVT